MISVSISLGGLVAVDHPADPPDKCANSEGAEGDNEHEDEEFAHGSTAVLGEAADDEDVPAADEEDTDKDDDEGLVSLEVLAHLDGLCVFVFAGLGAHIVF